MFGSAFIAGTPGGQPQANATVAASLAAGITSFDTAAAYGQSEATLGAALAHAGVTARRTRFDPLFHAKCPIFTWIVW